jgi:GT2 family glycosyltransferase
MIRNGENRGFGEGANQGAREALARGASSVFFVNNDVRLPPGTLARLNRELERSPETGIVGPGSST